MEQAIGSLSEELASEGLLRRTVQTGSPVRVHCSLAEKGRALEPALRGVEYRARKWYKD